MSALNSSRRPSGRVLPVRVLRSVALLFGLALAATACTTDPVVGETELEKSVQQTLADKVGVSPDSVDCPGELTGKVGTTMRCTLTAGGDTLGLTVTVTSVDGDNIKYDVEVDKA